MKLLRIAVTRPLASNEAIIWATFASAVGETKLALTAMLARKLLTVAGEGRGGYGDVREE